MADGASAAVVTGRFTKIGTTLMADGASAAVVTGRFTKIGTTLMADGASAAIVTGRFTKIGTTLIILHSHLGQLHVRLAGYVRCFPMQ